MPRVVVANKCDLPHAWDPDELGSTSIVVETSAVTGEGADALRGAMVTAMEGALPQRDVPSITNTRHAQLLSDARVALSRAADAARTAVPEEFVLADIHDARARLEEITGARTPDAILHAIFDGFCIGK